MEEKKKPGRPKGSTQLDEKKITYGHHMTPTAHEWIKENRKKIEQWAREGKDDE